MVRTAAKIDLAVAAAASGLILTLFFEPLRWLVSAWLSDPFYSHGFLVPLVSVALVWRLRHQLGALPTRAISWGLPILALSLLFALGAISRQAFYAANLALPVLIASILLYLKGWETLRLLLFPIAYLVLMVPLPFVNELALQLQVQVSMLSAASATLLGVPAQQQGASISVPGVAYTVGIACSGMSSIMALLTLGTLMVYLLKGSTWSRIALIGSIVPIAIAANTFRLSLLLWIAFRFGEDAGLAYHDTVAGFLSWGMAVAFLVMASKSLGCRLNLVASS